MGSHAAAPRGRGVRGESKRGIFVHKFAFLWHTPQNLRFFGQKVTFCSERSVNLGVQKSAFFVKKVQKKCKKVKKSANFDNFWGIFGGVIFGGLLGREPQKGVGRADFCAILRIFAEFCIFCHFCHFLGMSFFAILGSFLTILGVKSVPFYGLSGRLFSPNL